MKLFDKRELLIAVGFAVVSALAHLIWHPMVDYWQFVVTTLVFVAGLSVWLAKEWRHLQLFITRFYCVAVIVDILAEGLLQPFHRCTFNNIMCTGRMFLVFFAFWFVLQPVERWWTARQAKI